MHVEKYSHLLAVCFKSVNLNPSQITSVGGDARGDLSFSATVWCQANNNLFGNIFSRCVNQQLIK